MMVGRDLGLKMLNAIRGHVARSIDPLAARVQQLESLPAPRDGKDVDPELVKESILLEVGKAVAALPRPRDGEDGEPGRDALDIVVLEEIDEAKVYPRGTFACHRGGTIYATRKTSPITDSLEEAGWRVVMNGIAEESEEGLSAGVVRRTSVYTSGAVMVRNLKVGDDLAAMVGKRMAAWERELEQRSEQVMERAVAKLPKPKDGKDGKPGGSIEDFDIAIRDRTLGVAMKINGEVVMREVKLDLPIERGVFQSGRKYEKGDIVTYSGSAFIAQCATSAKPETNKDWRLFVKRGRDGKDAELLQEAVEP